MIYSTEPRYIRCVKGYFFFFFLSFSGRFSGDKYGKKIMDIATITGKDTAKTASKWAV